MLAILLSFPIFGVLVLLQTTIVSRIQLLNGTADLILLAILAWSLQKRNDSAWQWAIVGGLMVSIASGLPFGVPLLGYLLATAMAMLVRRFIWQVPMLAMFVVTFLGTVITQVISLVALNLAGDPILPAQALTLITLPSVVLNLLVAIPAYAILNDIAGWLYPETIEV
jgi:rod shape-determining protein MreD